MGIVPSDIVHRQISRQEAAYFYLLLYSEYTYAPFCLQTYICKHS